MEERTVPMTQSDTAEEKDRLTLNLSSFVAILLSLLLLLPVGMSIWYVAAYLLGLSPTPGQVEAWGYHLGWIVYQELVDQYAYAILVVGMLCLLFGITLLILCRKKVFSRQGLQEAPWLYCLAGLLFWALLSTLFSENLLHAWRGGTYMHDGLRTYLVYAGVLLAACGLREEKDRLWVLRLFGSVVCYLSLIMLAQEFWPGAVYPIFPSRGSAVFNNSNHFGYILCMGMLAHLGLWLYDRERPVLRALYLIGFCFLTYTLLVNDTFGAYLASAVTLPVVYLFFWKSGRKLAWREFLPVLLFVLISLANVLGLLPGGNNLLGSLLQFGNDVEHITEDSAGTNRMILWKQTVERIKQRPIFGFGPEGFYGENALELNRSPHNEYLQIAGYLGLPALGLYLAALVTLLIHHWKHIRELSATTLAAAGVTVVYLVSACFGNPVFNTAPYHWMFLGLTMAAGETLFRVEGQERLLVLRKRQLLTGLIAAAVVAVAILGGWLYLSGQTEAAKENSDLQCMRGAEMIALLTDKEGELAPGEYWFDGYAYTLLPGDEAMPEGYGQGTGRRAGATKAFRAEFGTDYGYDEGENYEGAVLRVTVEKTAAEPTIRLAWVWQTEESAS